MAMHSSMVLSPRTCLQLSWLHTATFLVFTTLFYANIISCFQPDIPHYNDHCASVVPESPPTDPESNTIPFPPDQDGYYLGGDGMFDLPNSNSNSSHFYYSPSDRKVLLLRTHHVHSTDADGVYKVEASLIIEPSSMSYAVEDIGYSFSYSPGVISVWSERGALSFQVAGFWSKSTGKLCMVGSSSTYSHDGKLRVLNALLNLNDVKRVSNITSLIRGTLHSLNSADDLSYFEPISLLMFPRLDYTYSSQVFEELDSVWTADTEAAKNSLSLPLSKSICSIFSSKNAFKLVYASGCDTSKSCNPLGEGVEFLPMVMSLSLIQCSHDRHSLRFLLEFSNISYYGLSFSPNATFVAEGSWNHKKNQLRAVACRILNATTSFSTSYIEDCSIRMSLRFPSVWSVRNTRAIVGYIWSNKRTTESRFFKRIRFQSNKVEAIVIPGLKYNYTLVERARKSCQQNRPTGKKVSQYPDANSNDMQFQMAIRNSSGERIGWGYGSPLFVDNHIPTTNVHFMNLSSSLDKEKFQPSKPLNISYKMDFPSFNFNGSSDQHTQVEIFAEGIYYPETGGMCMVGCRYLVSNNDQILKDDLMDCNIFVELQFPSTDSSNYIQGHIKSTREESDPLYLQPLSFSGVSMYTSRSSQSIWRMDLEIIMAMISNTLVCFFVGYQILHAKKHPAVFPLISLLMLVVLILGHMIPLMLNFEALFFSKQNSQYILRMTGGLLEANEVIVRVLTMVAFLLQVRLLQLVCSARLADENQKASWIAERKTLYLSLPLYIAGGLIALYVSWGNYEFGNRMNSTYIYSHQQHSLWVDLRSYGGLVLDGFLLPQILLNIIHNSRQNSLSCFFYIGTTFVRLLPHAYDLYRANYYANDLDWSYMYADQAADYYSTAWDIIIPLGCLLFAAIIYLQQRNGGRCFLPKRFKELEEYEKVPMAMDP